MLGCSCCGLVFDAKTDKHALILMCLLSNFAGRIRKFTPNLYGFDSNNYMAKIVSFVFGYLFSSLGNIVVALVLGYISLFGCYFLLPSKIYS